MKSHAIVAIHQPNYLPWAGFFNKMAQSDIFVLLDDVQLSRGKSLTTRVRVKTPSGPGWLTVPVFGKGDLHNINDVEIDQTSTWQRKHIGTIETSYARAPHFSTYAGVLSRVYNEKTWTSLVDLNIRLISEVTGFLALKTSLVRSSELGVEGEGVRKLVGILKAVGGATYLSGTGRGSFRYMDESVFEAEGVAVQYQSFVSPTYTQLWGEFVPDLSIIDVLFNCGDRTLDVVRPDY